MIRQTCKVCKHYHPINSLRGTCGSSAPVESWFSCSGWKPKNWDVKTAITCRIPEVLPDACDDCRDQRLCQQSSKQISIFDLLKEGGKEWN